MTPANLITEQTPQAFARREAGGKGFNLYLLTREGFPVPRWVILGADLFRRFRRAAGLERAIGDHLKQLEDHARVSAEIQKLILQTPLPPDVEEEVRAAYALFDPAPIAVRSSAVGEDSHDHSFAGQLSSFLFIQSPEEALQKVKACWASAYSERSLSYRTQRCVDPTGDIDVAVVFQEMIETDRSGVLFTCDPVKNDRSRVTINSVFGLGEGLVSGRFDGDTFVLDKENDRVISQEIVPKPRKLVRRDVGGGVTETSVPEGLKERPSLTREELVQLASMGKSVEGFYGHPQDIEWGLKDGRLYLLQSRPVTTALQGREGLFQIWDNSNIVESYGGITLPLTFTFARFAYHRVYQQFCEILLLPRKQIRRMDRFLSNMLGCFNGRIYYNLLNWYRLTSVLPLYRHNRAFMETMMGTDRSLEAELADRTAGGGKYGRMAARLRRLVTGLKFLGFHFVIQSMVNRFLSHFHEVYGEFRKKDYSRMRADQILADFRELEARLLWHWKAPIVNDYLCMIHFGLLKKLTSRWLGHLGDGLQNDLLCGEGSIESAEPTRELIRLAVEVAGDSGLRRLIESEPEETCLEVLNRSGYTEFLTKIDHYVEQYGFRCMNEMKLEQKDLHQDPSFLFVCLKNYLRSGSTELEAQEGRERAIRTAAEKVVRSGLTVARRFVYLRVLKHARKAVRNRETTRFCRTRIYGVVRAMFYGIGNDYTLRSMIDRPEDIFYLTLEELHGTVEGSLTVQDLRALVALRQAEYARYEKLEPARRFSTHGPVYWSNDCFSNEDASDGEGLDGNRLKGTGCCPGRVEGNVKVILSPDESMELDGEILVALRTDPGWIPLFPSASGLLVERGGLLSHSAIVAREMGLPTVVGVRDLTRILKTGMRLDGQTGVVELLDRKPS